MMMAFSYEWKKHPVLYNTQEHLKIQAKGNAAMCLALQQAKEEMSDALGMDSELKQSHKVGAVERRLRKYCDGCNRILPGWETDIKSYTTTNLKQPGVRKLHIFKWMLPHCKNWHEFMKDHNFDIYFPKLESLEERNCKRRKIEVVVPVFKPTNVLPNNVLDVLCDVYRKVVYVTRVMPYMYQEQCVEFCSDFIDHIMGTVRIVPPDEKLFQIEASECIEVDTFYLHLSSVLAPIAHEQEFRVTEADVRCDSMKTTIGGKSLTLLSRMAHTTERWATNMGMVMLLLQATVAFEDACPFAEALDEEEGVVTPREGFYIELQEAVHKTRTDLLVLQHSMAALRRDFCVIKCSFAPSVVLWVKRAVRLKEHKYRHLPGFVSRRQAMANAAK